MSVSAWTGPLIAFGNVQGSDYNTQGGPSLFQGGGGLLDTRPFYAYQTGQNENIPIYGFQSNTMVPVLDWTTSAAAPAAYAASQTPTAGTALTLVSSTSAPVTVGVSIVSATTGQTVTGLISIRGSAGAVAFGPNSAPVNIWNPTTLVAHNVTVTSAGDDSGATFTVAGYDIYGYAMTETITGAAVGAAAGKKAFKYIASITPAGTLSGSAVTAGYGLVTGLPLRADAGGYVVYTNSGSITTTLPTFVAADTNTATATTGDVRGTIAPAATARVIVFVTPSVANLATNTGLFGVTQA
ncbi:hypothetical protein [Ancylobacter sp.]|uniref:hypothetical protein n=1 Tax=Ancylobacter sp. TaxID=1872567 RepID=UPI003BAB0CB8